MKKIYFKHIISILILFLVVTNGEASNIPIFISKVINTKSVEEGDNAY